jgi:hypothetical protein
MSHDGVSVGRPLRRLALVLAFVLAVAGLAAQPAAATGGLTVTKTADPFAEKRIVYDWTIEKTVSPGSLELGEGESGLLTYWISATRTKVSETVVYGARGEICVTNDSGVTAVGVTVRDELEANLGGGNQVLIDEFEIDLGDLAPGETACSDYEVEFDPVPDALIYKNSARASASPFLSGFDLVQFNLPEPTVTEVIDEEADLGDLAQCPAGFTCVPGTNGPWHLTGSGSVHYTVTVTNVSAPCDSTHRLDNRATLVEGDTGEERTDTASATITTPPCDAGCTLTPGYWKTHSTYGPAPYDDTWALVGEDTAFFLSGKSYYQALWTSPGGNAYYILAHAYIAAKLNFLNGSDPSAAQAAFNSATALFNTYTPAQIGALRGSSTLRQQFVALATTLDNYNNGLIGPGHCPETGTASSGPTVPTE